MQIYKDILLLLFIQLEHPGKVFLIFNLSAVQLCVWPQIYVRKTLYSPTKCSDRAHRYTQRCWVAAVGKKQECFMEQRSVGERPQGPRLLCLYGSLRDVLMLQGQFVGQGEGRHSLSW